ncbi:hypothetical protein [Saccharicrinis aurantiacus]|uniref:hypothetical protein n=1 Tax=Saccharicrinis aurantiacus TaxID=1849719 RepID=UPI00083850D9|nr:hypothetical protein [Saccharicrinis aurantiacus]
MDISGKYKFTEDFGYGKDEGEAFVIQTGSKLEGTMSFTESIEGDDPFTVECIIEGDVNKEQVEIRVKSFKTNDVEYYPETRVGIINNKGQIVGSSEDEQGICGVFVFTPIEDV